jgi:hypothetical protein
MAGIRAFRRAAPLYILRFPMQMKYRFLGLATVTSLLLSFSLRPGLAQEDTFCADDQTPIYASGFADLKSFVGEPMGDPLTCEFADPSGSGDVRQQTSTGTALWRAGTAVSTFASGDDHWAISPSGNVSWSGPDIDPPIDVLAAIAPPADDQQLNQVPLPTGPDAAPTPSQSVAPDAAPPPPQPVGSIYWGAYIDGVPASMAGLDAFESALGKKVSIVHWGQSWGWPPANTFQTDRFDKVRNHGAIPMIDWGAWQLGAGTNQPNFRLATIANGNYDSFIRQWAKAAKDWRHPFFLRLGWEMNGNWQFPWSAQLNGNHPADYIAAWKHVHDIFVQQGATNATWVWCPNVSSNQTIPLNQVYPGDAYVDWTCLDGYNQGGTTSDWQTFAQIFSGRDLGGFNPHDSYGEMRTLAPSKPMMIGEVASSERGGSKAAWIRDMLQTVPTTYPQIKAVVWFDWNGGDPNLTWPIASSKDSQNAFAGAISSPVYATNAFSGLATSNIRPLAGN